MKTEFGKGLGVILSAMWLLIVGYFVAMCSFFAEGAPRSARLRILSDLGFTYFLVGLLPVLGFIVVMKILVDPLGKAALIFLASLAAVPIVLSMWVVL